MSWVARGQDVYIHAVFMHHKTLLFLLCTRSRINTTVQRLNIARRDDRVSVGAPRQTCVPQNHTH
jgi:hypothetical protein